MAKRLLLDSHSEVGGRVYDGRDGHLAQGRRKIRRTRLFSLVVLLEVVFSDSNEPRVVSARKIEVAEHREQRSRRLIEGHVRIASQSQFSQKHDWTADDQVHTIQIRAVRHPRARTVALEQIHVVCARWRRRLASSLRAASRGRWRTLSGVYYRFSNSHPSQPSDQYPKYQQERPFKHEKVTNQRSTGNETIPKPSEQPYRPIQLN